MLYDKNKSRQKNFYTLIKASLDKFSEVRLKFIYSWSNENFIKKILIVENSALTFPNNLIIINYIAHSKKKFYSLL